MSLQRLRLFVCGLLVFASAVPVANSIALAQTPPAGRDQPSPAGRETTAASVASYPLSAKMPVDPEVTVGTLPNGLRYYVRKNDKPARRAELRLVVKAG